MNIEEGIATAIFRHGFPLYDITVGSEERPPTKEQLDQAVDEVRGLNFKSEFVHPPNYKVKLLESFSLTNTGSYTDIYLNNIASALSVPKFLLMGTAKDLSRSSAIELIKMLKPDIKDNQNKIKLVVEEQILKPLMEMNNIDEVPEVIIGDIPILNVEIEAAIEKGEGTEGETP